MWGDTRSLTALFDAVAAAAVTDGLAESAFAWVGDWNGNPFAPPLDAQPGIYAWGEAHLQLAYVLQYEATGATRYLDVFLQRFRRLLALRDDRLGRVDVLRGRVMPAWGSVFFSGGQHTCFIVHAGMITYPAARFIHLAAADPALPSRYRNDIDEMQAALLETVDGFAHEWHDGPGAQEGYFTDTALGGRHLPVNQQNCLGRTMLLLAAPAGRPDYRARTAQLAHFLRRRLVLMPDGAYVWQYHPPIAPPFAASPAEDISHGAMNVDFAALCHRHGVVFDDEDMARFGRTFLQRVCQEAGRFADSVDGSGEEHRYADVIAYWGHLARTTPDVLAVLRQHYLRRDPPVRGPLALLALAMLGFYTPGS